MLKLCTWTNSKLSSKGLVKVSVKKFTKFIGLELAMSIVKFNAIEDYWSQSLFTGHADFKRVMIRYDFTNIRSSLTFEPQYSHAMTVMDPLWHSRKIMMNFLRNCAATVVSIGVLCFGENTIRCKARTGARSYIKSKPVKYGIRLYAMCGWRYTYLCNFGITILEI